MNIYELNNPIFKDVVIASLDAIVCADEDGNIILFNPAAEKMFGYSLGEVLGKPLTILMQEAVHAAHLDGFNHLIQTGKMRSGGRTLRTEGVKKDGTVFTHDMSLTAEKIDGRWVIVGILRDLTENIQLHEALKSHAYFLAQSEHVASMGSYRFEIASGQWRSSPVLDQIFGIEADFSRDIDGWLGLVHPEQREEMRIYLYENVLKKHQCFDRQYQIIRQSDGFERWMHGRGELEYDDSGQVVAMVGTIQDITVQKEADDKLRQLSRSVEQAGESIMITNRQGIIEYVNPAFTELTGYRSEEAVGKSPVLLNSGKQSKAFYEDLWGTILSGRTWRGSVVDRKKDGSLYPAMLTISPSTNEDGKVTHFIGIQNDLTEFRSLEDKFHQAQKMEAIGTLVGGIAHDFNNMLAGITGNLYLVRGKLKAYPELVSRLSDVDQICFRAADMISQLLAFARKGHVNLQHLSLTSFVKEALKLVEVGIPENIQLTQNICADDLVVLGDITQLQQVVLNLINNARDALVERPAPEISLALTLFTPDQAFKKRYRDRKITSQYAHLSVQDNGCGMSHADRQRVFEPFFTTKQQGKGTGLGLAMVFGAVQTHHGMVEVESDVGHGSIFHIYLPLQQRVRNQFDLAPLQKTLHGDGETILLADDDVHVREVNGEVLEDLGYRVLLAVDGVEAVSLFSKHQDQIALTILDVVMPEMGGREAAEEIRVLDPSAAILFTTGYDQAQVLDEKIIDSSRCGVLKKPYAIDELSRVVRKLID